MPHLRDKRKKEPGTESVDDESDEEEPGEDSDDEYSDKRDWLESMGLDKEQFPLLNPKTITPDQINNLRTIDQQPTSTVLIKGADTHALFNFLLNCKSLIANTGPLAQVPPTLLAPVAFDGAALKSLRVNQGILKHQQAKGMTQVNNLSVDLFASFLLLFCNKLWREDFKDTLHQEAVSPLVQLYVKSPTEQGRSYTLYLQRSQKSVLYTVLAEKSCYLRFVYVFSVFIL